MAMLLLLHSMHARLMNRAKKSYLVVVKTIVIVCSVLTQKSVSFLVRVGIWRRKQIDSSLVMFKYFQNINHL